MPSRGAVWAGVTVLTGVPAELEPASEAAAEVGVEADVEAADAGFCSSAPTLGT